MSIKIAIIESIVMFTSLSHNQNAGLIQTIFSIAIACQTSLNEYHTIKVYTLCYVFLLVVLCVRVSLYYTI